MDQNEPKTKQAERGRETLFRVSYQHQSKLIQIAERGCIVHNTLAGAVALEIRRG